MQALLHAPTPGGSLGYCGNTVELIYSGHPWDLKHPNQSKRPHLSNSFAILNLSIIAVIATIGGGLISGVHCRERHGSGASLHIHVAET